VINLTHFIAGILFMAAYNIPPPEFWRHSLACKDLMKAMRGVSHDNGVDA